MTDVQEQIKQLRGVVSLHLAPETAAKARAAADTLESQQARIARLEAVAEAAEKMSSVYTGDDRPFRLKQALAALQTDKEPGGG